MTKLIRRVRLTWNGETVLDAKASAVMAADIVANFLNDNFAGMRFRAWRDANLGRILPALLDLDLSAPEPFRIGYADDTGKAHATVSVYSESDNPAPDDGYKFRFEEIRRKVDSYNEELADLGISPNGDDYNIVCGFAIDGTAYTSPHEEGR